MNKQYVILCYLQKLDLSFNLIDEILRACKKDNVKLANIESYVKNYLNAYDKEI